MRCCDISGSLKARIKKDNDKVWKVYKKERIGSKYENKDNDIHEEGW